jgi:3-hydroxyacyl-CoA dehydrogenase/3a,7a,12a-trihydroxy-5b-cholest-24-enoyl-CoA hydratase
MAQQARAAVVTGAGGGLGAAFARALAQRGEAVLVNNRSHPGRASSAEAVAQAIGAAGGTAVAECSAVDAPGAAEAIVSAALAAFGRLDTLVLNAGISGPAAKLPGQALDDFRAVMEINLFANVALVNAALPHLLAGPAGRIVFISSSAGLHGVRGRAPYSASKGALNAYAMALAAEQARGSLRVNVLSPYADTAMTRTTDAAGDPRLAPEQVVPALLALTDPACMATGRIVIAGAGSARLAAAMESATFPARNAADLAALLAQEPLPGPRRYPHAEAAFADFFGDVEAGG